MGKLGVKFKPFSKVLFAQLTLLDQLKKEKRLAFTKHFCNSMCLYSFWNIRQKYASISNLNKLPFPFKRLENGIEQRNLNYKINNAYQNFCFCLMVTSFCSFLPATRILVFGSVIPLQRTTYVKSLEELLGILWKRSVSRWHSFCSIQRFLFS